MLDPPGLSCARKRRAQRCTQFRRLRDRPAWQTADEVREVLIQFQRVFGEGLKTRTSLPSARASGTSSTDHITEHATRTKRHLADISMDPSASAPFCTTDSDLGETTEKDGDPSVSVPHCCFGSASRCVSRRYLHGCQGNAPSLCSDQGETIELKV